MKKILTTLLLLVIFSQIKATHIVGAVINYKYLGGLDYKVTLKLNRDCSGIPMNSTEIINVTSASLAANLTFTVTQTSYGIIDTYCPSVSTTCTSTSAILPGYQYYYYEGIITLPASASDWSFSYENCCRNNNINNLVAPGTIGVYVNTTLDNLTSAGGFNNSVDFILENLVMYGSNITNTLNQAGIDIDGDSVHYSLVDAMDGIITVVPYISGLSGINPLGSTGTMTIDPVSGSLTFMNTINGVDVVAIKADEYRNGILIASTIKDMQIGFMNMGANHLPTLSGVNGGANYLTNINLCPSSSLSFTVNGNDIDVTDPVNITLAAMDIVGGNLTVNTALQETATFTWTPTASDIRPQPYLLVLRAKDNCGQVTYGYLVYVNQCGQDSVWAGDANADYIVNNYDVLNIGIGNGTSGIVRLSATTNWVAEYCPDWTNSFISGINYKHADCNGDGTIDATDMNAVTLNYGQFHTKTSQIGTYKTAGLPDLYLDATGVVATPGSTLQIPIMLGTSSAMMNNIYGIAGHLNVSNTLSASISVSNPISWLGNSSNSFLFQKHINSNDIAFTLVRNNQTNVNGSGQIVTLSIPLSASAIVGTDIEITFSDLKFIDNSGTEITDYNVLNDTMKIVSLSGLNDQVVHNEILVYPNPMNNEISIQLKSLEFENVPVTIVDMKGNTVFNQELRGNVKHDLKINTSNLASGMYFIKIATSTETVIKKITK